VNGEDQTHYFEVYDCGFVLLEGNLDVMSIPPLQMGRILTRSLLHEGHWLVRANRAFGYVVCSPRCGFRADESTRSALAVDLERVMYLENLELGQVHHDFKCTESRVTFGCKETWVF
jgi:hypothetical protein